MVVSKRAAATAGIADQPTRRSARQAETALKKEPSQAQGSSASSETATPKESTGDKRPIKRRTGQAVSNKKAKKDTSAPSSLSEASSDSTATGQPHRAAQGKLRIVTWNVNGIKSLVKSESHDWLLAQSADIICLQETKCVEKDLPGPMLINGYHTYWLSAEKAGYSGTGLLSKTKPLKVTYGLGIAEHDKEGRVITAEYPSFFLVNTYVPNSGRGLVRLDYRLDWEDAMRAYLASLSASKPVVLTGDLNVSHQEIDLANPKTNKKNAGFTQEERDKFGELLANDYVDCFRYLYPNKEGAYTFWSNMRNSRERNVGWRLDYFVLANQLLPFLHDCVIHDQVKGSDHCPVSVYLDLKA